MGALEIYWADMSHEMPEHEQITLGVGGKTHGTASWSGDMYVRAAGTAWWELPATAQWTRTRASIRHVGMIWRRRWEGCWPGDQEPRYSTHRNKWWGRMRFKYVFCWHTHRLEVSIVGSKEKSWKDTFFFSAPVHFTSFYTNEGCRCTCDEHSYSILSTMTISYRIIFFSCCFASTSGTLVDIGWWWYIRSCHDLTLDTKFRPGR